VSGSRRSAAIEPFLAVEVAERAAVLERDGADIVHLEYGEPDFDAPAVIRDALDRAVKDGRTRYTHSLGLPALREAIAEHYATTYGVTVSPDQVLVTPGTSPAMMLLFGHLLDGGDEVVLSNPYYACYPNFIRFADGVPVEVAVAESDGFQYHPDAIGERLTARTRAILVNSPGNPTGAVLAPDRLAAIAALAREGGPMIVSDEIYHGLGDGGRDHCILEYTDRAFVLNGFSKAFAMTGWRLGYLIAPHEHARALQRLAGNFFISTNEFVQWAGVAALREAVGETRHFARIFAERRRVMVAGVRALGFGVAVEPAGAFYVLANARRWTTDSRRFAYEVLEASHVALTPGAAFGSNAEGYMRFSYTASVERIREGLRRLSTFLAGR
jgi:(5-formylfuran-3-yl)methyl phosphate transaminase